MQSAGDSQAVTEDDCIVTDFSCPDKQLSSLELRQQRLFNRSVSETNIKYTTGKLTRLDLDTIKTGVTEASYLLKHQFPNVKSLQSPCYGPRPVISGHLYRFYMFMISIVYAVHYGLIFIYDSMSTVISDAVQMQAAAILKSI